MSGMIALDRYFAAHRKALGRLSPSQVVALEELLLNIDADDRVTDPRHAAYMLATAWHETDKTMRPIREYGRGRGKRYGKPGGNSGQIPYGRGYVQLTWDANYERADRELGLDGALIADYDLAMDPAIAYRILSSGMREGWFTGRRLSHYIAGRKADYIGARRIINGTDRAALIADYARAFEGALKAAT
jgi:hypothetical protein